MTEHEYKKRHIKLWQEIVDYLHKVKRGYVKIDYEYIIDLEVDLLNTQEISGVVFTDSGMVLTGIYNDCYACEFALLENGNDIDICVKCPLINKLGCVCHDKDSGAYELLAKAYKSKDYEKAIRLAIKIRDAWREVK